MTIFEIACQWLDLSDANLTLDLSEDDNKRAQIKVLVGRDLPHNESDIGTDALAYEDATMTLNVLPGDEFFEHMVLHEFGHALGAEHEHRHPEADIPWNEAAVLQAYLSVGWTHADVERQILSKWEDNGLVKTTYDPTSIMHYTVPQAFTHGDWETGPNLQLSEKDLDFMRLAYPHD